jgi:hypothetical protein
LRWAGWRDGEGGVEAAIVRAASFDITPAHFDSVADQSGFISQGADDVRGRRVKQEWYGFHLTGWII